MTKTSWGRYVAALSDSQSEIARRSDVAQSTVSRWIAGEVPPKAETVIKLARSFDMSPVVALVAAGFLAADELTNPGTRPRALQLHEYSDRELALETLRRVDSGSHPELEDPLDGAHPAMLEHAEIGDVGDLSDTGLLDAVSETRSRRGSKRDYGKAALRGKENKTDGANDAAAASE